MGEHIYITRVYRQCILIVLVFFVWSPSILAQRKKTRTDTSVYIVEPVFFNSAYADFAPVYYKNGLAFTSNRINSLGAKYVSESGTPLTDIFYVEGKNGKWKAVKPLGDDINSKFNDGPCTFNKEGTEMYFNRNYEEIRFQSQLRIIKARLVNGEWKLLYDLPFNSNTFSCAHPSLSPSGKELYFSSNMPGGFGGMDLYVSYLKDTIWSDPINLGSNVNTPGNELFPFIHLNGKLYFSSNGREGLGGLDIFYTEKQNEKWKAPENIGTPFNSSKDDFGFIKDSTDKKGFLSSNRAHPDNDQIYSFKLDQPDFENCLLMKENNYCVTLFEETTELNDTLPFRYEWEIEGKIIKGKRVKHCFIGPGDYEVKLHIIDSLLNNTLHDQASYTIEIRDEEQPYIEIPETALVGQLIDFSGKKSNLSDCSVNKYFWDFGDGEYKNGLSVKHAYKKPGTYEVRLGVSSDSKGASEENEICEKCVFKKIIIKGRK